jgi:VanZ family protein
MNKLYTLITKESVLFEKLYRILFYILCLLVLVSAVIKIGGNLDKKFGIGDLKIRLDHLLHALAYFIFSLYYIGGKYFGLKLFRKRTHIFFFILLFFLGFLAEVLQIWVPYRSFSLMDMLSNLVGIGGGYIVTVILLKKGYDDTTVWRCDGMRVWHYEGTKGRRDEETKRRRAEETKRRRDKETKRRRDEETKRRRDEETKRRRDEETKRQRDEETKRQKKEG